MDRVELMKMLDELREADRLIGSNLFNIATLAQELGHDPSEWLDNFNQTKAGLMVIFDALKERRGNNGLI